MLTGGRQGWRETKGTMNRTPVTGEILELAGHIGRLKGDGIDTAAADVNLRNKAAAHRQDICSLADCLFASTVESVLDR
jgi:hypothetical protein